MGEGGSEPKKQLGKIMLQQKLVTQGELQELLQAQQEDPSHRLASTALRRGNISVNEALQALSEQHGVPAVNLDEQVVSLEVMRLIPVEIAREHQVFPFRIDGEAVCLAMASPGDAEMIQEVEFLTALTVTPHVALDDVIRRVLDEAALRHDRQEHHFVGREVSDAQLAELGIPRPAPLSMPGEDVQSPQLDTLADAPVSAGELPPEPTTGAIPMPAQVAMHGQPAAPAVPAPAAIPMPATAGGPVAMPRAAGGAIPMPAALGGPAASPVAVKVPSEPPPLDAAFAKRTPPSVPPPANAHAGKKILVVDADAAARHATRTTLEPFGLVVLEADSGVSALERVREETPALIVVDDALSDIHGFDVCHRLKASDALRAIPIVVTSSIHSGWRMAQDLEAVFQVGLFLEKPVNPRRLALAVQQLLSGESAEEELPALSAQAETLWNEAMALFEAGHVDEAIQQLQEGSAVEPNAFELQYHLGLLHGRREELFAAITALERAIVLQPRHFSALKNLAVVYQRAGFVRKSFEIWERACWCAPDDETRAQIKDHMLSLL